MVTYGAAATYGLLFQQKVVDMRFSQSAGQSDRKLRDINFFFTCNNRSYDLVSNSYTPSPVLLTSLG